jgi:hypothetical protein
MKTLLGNLIRLYMALAGGVGVLVLKNAIEPSILERHSNPVSFLI